MRNDHLKPIVETVEICSLESHIFHHLVFPMRVCPLLLFVIGIQIAICYGQNMAGYDSTLNSIPADKVISTTMLKVSSSSFGGKKYCLDSDG